MQTAEQLTRSAMSEIASGNPSPTHTTPAGRSVSGMSRQSPAPDAQRQQAITTLVAQVFTRLEAIFPRTFSSAFANADMLTLARREMAAELARWPALPTRQVLERAMSEIRQSGSTWPPTIPALIKGLAPTPADFGMPATADAWREVCAHSHEPSRWRWSHAAVRLAGGATGWWEMSHVAPSRVERLERRFAREYEALVNRVMAGEQLQSRALLESDGSRSQAELAARAGTEQAAQRVADAGLPHRMSASQGLAALKAATGRA